MVICPFKGSSFGKIHDIKVLTSFIPMNCLCWLKDRYNGEVNICQSNVRLCTQQIGYSAIKFCRHFFIIFVLYWSLVKETLGFIMKLKIANHVFNMD